VSAPLLLLSRSTSLDAFRARLLLAGESRRRDQSLFADTVSFSKCTSACSNGIPADRANGPTVEATQVFAKREGRGAPGSEGTLGQKRNRRSLGRQAIALATMEDRLAGSRT